MQYRHGEVTSMWGKKEVASITSEERGNIVTTHWNLVPPLIVFPEEKKNMKEHRWTQFRRGVLVVVFRLIC